MMLGMGLYLFPTHTNLVYKQSRFFTDGRGGGGICTQPNPIKSIFSWSVRKKQVLTWYFS